MNEESIFAAAIQRTDPQQRAAFLDGACAEDAQLRARVEALLRSHEEGGSFLDQPAAPIPPTVAAAPISEGPGTRLGPYKLLQRIGEGGFGVVYMAEQHKPVRRKVALKIIKPGMDTNEVIARFESERQALALMDHPNIAKVFDAGATDTGRPYFVMELVKGVPLIDFCDENHLTTRQRLELFVQVCWAIQHAHQKGIIHRDLKPSNVMVTIHDNKPVPKVIDFGVSKAISQQLTEKTLFTAYGQMVGTPTYMSPEQAQMSGLDVDTRSDIYSLGVMLFELLTGSTPLDAERLRKSGYEEMQRLIREEEAPRPSQRLSTQSGDAIVKIAKCRGADAGQLGKQLRGELDWIVIKALEKDRNRRYETANGFAADVERHLNDEAVHARPPSALYRLQKLLRRNRVAAILTATIFLSLIVTAVGTSVGLVQANRYAAQLQDSKSEIEGNLATITEQKEVIEKTNRGLKQQQTELLLQQAELLVEQRRNGYKRRVQPILKELSSRNFNSEKRQSLRRLAVATLGDPTALEPMVELKDFPAPIRHIDLSPNGNWLAICLLSGESYLYEIATERSVPIHAEFKDERRDDYHYAKTEFVNDTEIVVNSVQAGEIQRWELRENDSWELSFQKPLEHSPYHFAVAEDGSRSLWVGGAGVLIVMDRLNSTRVSTKRIVNSRGERVRHTHVDISPNGKTVAAKIKDPGRQKWETMLWDVDNDVIRYLPGGEWGSVRFSPDGRRLMVASVGGIEVYDAPWFDKQGELKPTFFQRSEVVGGPLELAPDGRTLFIPSRQSNRIRVWDLSSNSELGEFHHPGQPGFALVSDNADMLVTASSTNLRIWNLGQLPERRVLAGHSAGSDAVAYSPDGTLLGTTGMDDIVRIWNPDTGELIKELQGGGEAITFSAGGCWVAAGSRDSSRVRIWETETWNEAADFDAQLGSKIWSLLFCDHDRKLVISGPRGVRLLEFNGNEDSPVPEFSSDDETRLSRKCVEKVTVDATRLLWKEHTAWAPVGDEATFVTYDFNAPSEPVRLDVPAVSGYGTHDQVDGSSIIYNLESGRFDQFDVEMRPIGRAFGQPLSKRLELHSKSPWAATSFLDPRSKFQIWNRETGQLLLDFPSGGGIIWEMAWHPQRHELAVVRSDGVVELWDIDRVLQELSDLGLTSK